MLHQVLARNLRTSMWLQMHQEKTDWNQAKIGIKRVELYWALKIL